MSNAGEGRRSETFSELHSKKNNSEKIVTHIFTRWCDKVMYKMFEESVDSKSFQRKLLDIAKWRDNDITYSYRKFRKWLKKRGPKKIYSERELEKVFAEYIVSSLKCLCDNTKIVETVLTERSLPTIDDIYYKCIRRIARHLYDHPKLLKDKSSDDVYSELFKITKTLLLKFIPFKRLLEEMELHKRENEDKLHSYNFDKIGNSEGEDHHRHTILSRNSSTTQNTLRYFSSDEFENDYYNPNDDADIDGDLHFGDGEDGREENMLKQIDMRINYATKPKKSNNNFM